MQKQYFQNPEVLKSEPIENFNKATLYFSADGKKYSLNLITDSKNTPQILKFSKNYGEVTMKLTLAPIVFINTFENLLQELQNAGIEISRAPALDLITGTSNKYYAIVVNATVEKDGKPVVDKYSSRIILINESRLSDISLEFYINDILIKIDKLEMQKVSEVQQQKQKTNLKEQQNILLYPNPATKGELVTVEFIMSKKGEYEVYLYNNLGQKICKIDDSVIAKNNEEGKILFKVPEGLESGVYHIVIQNKNGEKSTANFIVQ